MAKSYPSIVGNRHGRLVVLSEVRCPGERLKFSCVCDCGTTKSVTRAHLSTGLVKSCGCLHDEKARTNTFKHGHARAGAKAKTYGIWAEMIARCHKPTNKAYSDYGGRGISVCSEWRSSYVAFYRSMGDKPRGMSLDRINNDGDYEPGNVAWRSLSAQGRNKRSNRLIKFRGETKCLAEWVEILGVNRDTVLARLNNGVPAEIAFMAPVVKNGHSRVLLRQPEAETTSPPR